MQAVVVLISGCIGIICSMLMERKWKSGNEEIDRGICLCYWKLSYRRKFIRTLWMIPIESVLILCFYETFRSTICTALVAIFFAVATLLQSTYNYKKWKKNGIV